VQLFRKRFEICQFFFSPFSRHRRATKKSKERDLRLVNELLPCCNYLTASTWKPVLTAKAPEALEQGSVVFPAPPQSSQPLEPPERSFHFVAMRIMPLAPFEHLLLRTIPPCAVQRDQLYAQPPQAVVGFRTGSKLPAKSRNNPYFSA
jgi:hypothetical protein